MKIPPMCAAGAPTCPSFHVRHGPGVAASARVLIASRSTRSVIRCRLPASRMPLDDLAAGRRQRMTDRVDLEAIRTRADAATPGPWRTWNDGHVGAPAAHIGGIFMPTNCADHAQWMPDATFAAHAREDVPALVAELAVLRAQRDAALAACDAAVAEHDHAATEATARAAAAPAAGP